MSQSRHYPKRPIIGVGAVVFKGASVLLIQRSKPPKIGEWSLPGGAQDLGETASAAAAREVLEETGVHADIIGLLDVVDYIEPDESHAIRHHYTLVDYLARWTAGEPKAASDARKAQWVALDGLGDVPLWSETRRIILLGAARLGDI
ncbi:DNA mismatch repair protein MutT [Iodidimonas gelatinilytica]|uniref:DNA mismatch repair protein MutT n=1 Tax=Iodidimonas gelatinilytica TaxID=1236966 RepID=A0A5A7MQB4_9PROT|nr:NUDIX hydrolase [Iodidimonas gelatinilytica]GEQ97148.1 DNA mismatch repair protein MutT [Iodidimonas gelatinilytica]GEQ99480.1 DNA mismatch repair protein MutT [Iodidimonas gelatinilytica]